jgi:hypothetical protein
VKTTKLQNARVAVSDVCASFATTEPSAPNVGKNLAILVRPRPLARMRISVELAWMTTIVLTAITANDMDRARGGVSL